jgi:hypothetical protein
MWCHFVSCDSNGIQCIAPAAVSVQVGAFPLGFIFALCSLFLAGAACCAGRLGSITRAPKVKSYHSLQSICSHEEDGSGASNGLLEGPEQQEKQQHALSRQALWASGGRSNGEAAGEGLAGDGVSGRGWDKVMVSDGKQGAILKRQGWGQGT